MPVSSKFFVCAALCLAARGAQAARFCLRNYDSDDCSGDPAGDVFWEKDGACTTDNWIYICSEDLTSNIPETSSMRTATATATGLRMAVPPILLDAVVVAPPRCSGAPPPRTAATRPRPCRGRRTSPTLGRRLSLGLSSRSESRRRGLPLLLLGALDQLYSVNCSPSK